MLVQFYAILSKLVSAYITVFSLIRTRSPTAKPNSPLELMNRDCLTLIFSDQILDDQMQSGGHGSALQVSNSSILSHRNPQEPSSQTIIVVLNWTYKYLFTSKSLFPPCVHPPDFAMCFANKKQADNYRDETDQPRDNEKSTKGDKSTTPSTDQSPQTIPPVNTVNTLQLEMSSPKVAIVIYTMYGHIAKRSFLFVLLPASWPICFCSCRGRESWHRECRWKRWYLPVRSHFF